VSVFRLLDDRYGAGLILRARYALRRWYSVASEVDRIEHELGDVGDEMRKRSLDLEGRR
jgi:hypothetical protein